MKHLFVPYEIALKLKEKGFNEPCFGDYRQWDGGEAWLHIYQDSDYEQYNANTIECSAPIYQQAINWLIKTLKNKPIPPIVIHPQQ